MNNDKTIKHLFEQFDVTGSFRMAKPYGSGHINDTYLVQTGEPAQPDYILRRTNQYVFREVPGLVNNIFLITNHMRRRKRQEEQTESGMEYILQLLPAVSGAYYVLDEHNDYWCLLYFIPGSKSLDVVETPEQATEGGKAFGNFIRYLADFPVDQLHITIPHFHDVEKRLQWFHESIEEAPKDRLDQVKELIPQLEARAGKMSVIGQEGRKGHFPLRATHNDTKFNNVLLDESDRAICIIDLDTVMPGYVHYDFGDALRTIANTGEEDDQNLDNIRFNLKYFKAFTKGYLSSTIPILTDKEKELLPVAPFMMTYSQTLRFLTDYLQDDIYYKTQYPEHNLQRTKAQWKLFSSMVKSEEEIKSYIYSFS